MKDRERLIELWNQQALYGDPPEWLALPDALPDDMTFGELMDSAPPGTKGFFFDIEGVPEEELETFEEELGDQVNWLMESRRAEQLLTGQEP